MCVSVLEGGATVLTGGTAHIRHILGHDPGAPVKMCLCECVSISMCVCTGPHREHARIPRGGAGVYVCVPLCPRVPPADSVCVCECVCVCVC